MTTKPWLPLADSEWVNIVNNPEVLDPMNDTEDRVRIAVRLTEAKLRELNSPATPSLAAGGAATLTDARIENAARAIYESWAAVPGFVRWVAGGNSHKQDDARRLARAILSEAPANVSTAAGVRMLTEDEEQQAHREALQAPGSYTEAIQRKFIEVNGLEVGARLAGGEAKDAARYRWLRQRDWFDSPLCVVMNPKQAVKPGNDCPSRSRLDAAIDSAMAAALSVNIEEKKGE